uniref:Receptor ligand binding region domain-containing protein n=1 Tax=Tetranychus urticae TaxID=32264 RepID=T1KKT8_TETUR
MRNKFVTLLTLVDFIEHFNWTYVSLISSEGQYGESGSSAFRTHARMRNICFAIQEKVVQSANDTEYDRIIESLKRKGPFIIVFYHTLLIILKCIASTHMLPNNMLMFHYWLRILCKTFPFKQSLNSFL